MLTAGIIGAGAMGFEEARALVKAGYHVILANSRGPESLKEKIDELGENASAALPFQAAEKADVILVALPYKAFHTLPIEQMNGKIAVLVSNYDYAGSDPKIDSREISFAEVIAARYPDIRWVRGLNNLNSGVFISLVREKGDPERSALPVASDDAEALEIVCDMIHDMGFDTVEMHSIRDSRRFEPMTPAFLNEYLRYPEKLMEFFSNLNGGYAAPPFDPGKTVSKEKLNELLNSIE